MDSQIVEAWDQCRSKVQESIIEDAPASYLGLVELIVRHLANAGVDMDPARITVIDHGEYQGTLVFVIGECGYQPDRYWILKVCYGSCSGCDTLEAALEGDEVVQDLMTLSLHIVQGLKEI